MIHPLGGCCCWMGVNWGRQSEPKQASKRASEPSEERRTSNTRKRLLPPPTARENELDKEGEREGAFGFDPRPAAVVVSFGWLVDCRGIIVVAFEKNWNGFVAPRDCGTVGQSAPISRFGKRKTTKPISNGPSRRSSLPNAPTHGPKKCRHFTGSNTHMPIASTHDGYVESLAFGFHRTYRVTDLPSLESWRRLRLSHRLLRFETMERGGAAGALTKIR
jgi:hypothetical protein